MSDYCLLNRETFFSDLIEQIGQAKKAVVFDAYIWIADEIGEDVLRACLRAADRGVKIFIRHDLSAGIFEHTPGRLPMFFDDILLNQKAGKFFDQKNGFLTPKTFNLLAYLIYGKQPRPVLQKNLLVQEAEKHPNIFLQNLPLFNHGKLILVDEVAYVGGQCISKDYTKWIDYNLKTTNPIFARNISKQIAGEEENLEPLETKFIDNKIPTEKSNKKNSIHYFLKNFIETSSDELIIEMAYLGKWYVPILKKALKRGVSVTLLVTKNDSDTNHHTNMWVLSDLFDLKSKKLSIVFAKENMVHTKGLATREKMTLGACNFHNACGYFFGLNEQNIFSTNRKIVAEVFSQFQKDCLAGEVVTSKDQLPSWSKSKAFAEMFFVYLSSYVTLFNKKRINQARKEALEILRENYSSEF